MCAKHNSQIEIIEYLDEWDLEKVCTLQQELIPHLNPSIDYQPDIKRFFDTEKNFMQKWCEQEYKEDYNTWNQLTNADTLSINIAY